MSTEPKPVNVNKKLRTTDSTRHHSVPLHLHAITYITHKDGFVEGTCSKEIILATMVTGLKYKKNNGALKRFTRLTRNLVTLAEYI